MKQALTLTTKISAVILLSCLAIKINAYPMKTTTSEYTYNRNCAERHFYAKKMGIPISYSTTQTNTGRTQTKSKMAKDAEFKNYVYIKAGIARTQYNKFKDGSDSIYIVKKPNIGLMYQIGIGHKFMESIRGDLTLQYGSLIYKGKDQDYDLKQKIRLFSILANGYYDIPIKNSFIAYLAAGLGAGHNKTSDLNDSKMDGGKWKGKDQTNIIWNIGAGIRFDATKRFTLDLGYRYLDLGRAKTKTSTMPGNGTPKTQKITAHQIMGSLIYNF